MKEILDRGGKSPKNVNIELSQQEIYNEITKSKRERNKK